MHEEAPCADDYWHAASWVIYFQRLKDVYTQTLVLTDFVIYLAGQEISPSSLVFCALGFTTPLGKRFPLAFN